MRSSIRRACLLSLLLIQLGLAGPAAAQKVGILLSSNETAYLEALEGFKGTLDNGQLEFVMLKLERLSAGDTAAARECDLIFSIGTQATVRALESLPQTPVVAAMLLRPSAFAGQARLTGVYLEPPVRDQFAWLQGAFPQARRIALLYHPAESGAVVAEAEKAARALGLKLVTRPIEHAGEIAPTLERLQGSIDLLWGVSDSVVLNTATARDILGFSLRSGTPFAAPASTWVKAGALCGWDWDYRDIGAQAAELGRKLLNGAAPESLPAEKPRKLLYALNLRTAKALKLELDPQLVGKAHLLAGQ